MMYYCASHKEWEPLSEQILADESLCDFCCFHKPCPLGHDDEYWEEGWDEFAAEIETDKESVSARYIAKYQRGESGTEKALVRAPYREREEEVIIDYVDFTGG